MKKLFLRWRSIWQRERERIILFASVCLALVLAFEAGMMAAGSAEADPLVVEVPAVAPPLPEADGVVAGVAVAVAETPRKECAFVGSRNSDLYHLPTCAPAKRIKSENIVCFTSSEDAEKRGYKPGCLK